VFCLFLAEMTAVTDKGGATNLKVGGGVNALEGGGQYSLNTNI